MPFGSRPLFPWKLRTRTLELGRRTLLMGIVNITPDSFSDGGRYFSAAAGPEAAVELGLRLLAEGADLLDLGAESTRPGAVPISADEEQSRLLPALEALASKRPNAILSVDTYHASTTRTALDAGAEIINDVSGLTWDSEMAATLGAAHPPPGLVLMHTRGRPSEWHALPPLAPDEVAPLVRDELDRRLSQALHYGVPRENIVLDPGFGFGKLGATENFALLRGLSALHSLGLPLLAGLSRKGFLQTASRRDDAPQSAGRLHATLAANTAAILAGAHILRVHDVAAARDAADIADALLESREAG